ncbi:MAG: sulfite exporter TauE/SafE family protein [Burkholderiales bacterium]|nr:sulfite exporter TauE/SafE family protein [Burkholderiales bacterium]
MTGFEPTLWWVVYPAMGLLAGFFAGLLGIGGGMILVTLMVIAFDAQGFPADRVMHLALGTSMATIIFTSIKSAHSHHARGAVRWDIIRNSAFGLVAGTLIGTAIADTMRSKWLAIVFLAFVVYSAINMMFDMKPKPTRQLPGPAGQQIGAAVVGVLSALVGAGGGFITVPLMSLCNVPLRQCVGTSSALGLPIAAAGTIGYLITGWDKDHLPPLSLGYIYLPALIGIVLGTFVTVPLGAKLAHTLPIAKLKKVFAIVLSILAVKMIWGLMHP